MDEIKLPKFLTEEFKETPRVTKKDMLPNTPKHLLDTYVKAINQYIDCMFQLRDFQIPDRWPTEMMERYGFQRRILHVPHYVERYMNKENKYYNLLTEWYAQTYMGSYCLIDKPFIDDLATYLEGKKVLEVFAGTGHLSYALQERGIEIYTTTFLHKEPNDIYYEMTSRKWPVDIEDMDALEAVNTYAPIVDYIIMSWAPTGHNGEDYQCYLKMKELNPDCKMIFIGQPKWAGSESMKAQAQLNQEVNLTKNLASINGFCDFVFLVGDRRIID